MTGELDTVALTRALVLAGLGDHRIADGDPVFIDWSGHTHTKEYMVDVLVPGNPAGDAYIRAVVGAVINQCRVRSGEVGMAIDTGLDVYDTLWRFFMMLGTKSSGYLPPGGHALTGEEMAAYMVPGDPIGLEVASLNINVAVRGLRIAARRITSTAPSAP